MANPLEIGIDNPFLDYQPETLAEGAVQINQYIPVLSQLNPQETKDQVLAAATSSSDSYAPQPMLVETIDSETADRIRRGLRKEVVTHTVQQGETLGKIAKDYGINVATILEDNGIKPEDLNTIKPGTDLSIAPEKKTDSLAWLDQLNEEERLAREKREKERLAQVAKSSKGKSLVSSSSSATATPGKFRKPISAFCQNGYHAWAVDCAANTGVAIYAAAAGVVEVADSSGWNGGYGITIVIDHGNGWKTRYAHLNSVNVSPGQTVGAGAVIAANGNTGRSTGPHLHWEIIKNGQRLNPESYI